MNIKYKHLYAWDRMMASTLSWSEMMQKKAEELNAPIDVIYFNGDKPVCASELKPDHQFFTFFKALFL